MIRAELKKLVDAFLAEHDELGLTRIDASEAEVTKIIEAVQSMPFLSSKNMIIVKDISANKPAAEQIEKIIGLVGEDSDLVIYDQALDKRTVLYKTLKKQTDLHDFADLDERTTASWLVSIAKTEGGEISGTDALYLIARVGGDQMLLHNEVKKILTYDRHITRKTIDELTEPSPQSKIFDLLDAAFAGKTERSLELYEDQRKQRVEPQQIFAMLSWQLQIIALIKAAGDKPPEQIAADAKMSPYVVRKTSGLARRITMSQIKSLVTRMLEIDVLSKSTALDLDEALKTFISTELN